jgi:hypothetical protein
VGLNTREMTQKNPDFFFAGAQVVRQFGVPN